jgi:hypothetical protein
MDFFKASEVSTPEQAERQEYEGIMADLHQIKYLRIHHKTGLDTMKELEEDAYKFADKHKLGEKAEKLGTTMDEMAENAGKNVSRWVKQI